MRYRLLLCSYFAVVAVSPASGQTLAAVSAPDVAALVVEVRALREEQRVTAARIAALEAALAAQQDQPALSPPTTPIPAVAAAPASPARSAPSTVANRTLPAGLALSGDLRLRYESNFGDRGVHNRDRGVLRARLRASYAVTDWLSLGTELDTGDPDDPNSTDTTLSGFDDDLDVSLSQAYLRATLGSLQLQGGKFVLPFVRTEMVWDGDVNPEGVSAVYTQTLGKRLELRAAGLYFLIDENAVGPDSRMIGGQVGLEFAASPALKLGLAGSYYDYTLRSLTGADAGDIRTNRFAAGRYLSDYNLLDIVGTATWSGLGARWPIRITGDYVRNFGADIGATGYGGDISIGRAAAKGDWRFGYGYAEAGVDAVLAAFSHDNTAIATNYRQHSLSIDYVPRANLTLNATFYRYRPKDALLAGTNEVDDWLNRLRLNLLVVF